MKMIKGMGLLVVALLLAGQANAYTPYTGFAVKGSAHDFVQVYQGENGQTSPALNLCSTCHEMHRPNKMEPLWGRQNPDAGLAWAIQSHGTTHLLNDEDGSSYINAADFVNARSGMCLSCHDGVSAIANGVTMAVGDANFGFDLTQNHNIGRKRSAKYEADGVTPTAATTYNDQVEQPDGSINYYLGCGSCHAMHHSKNRKLVRDAETGEAGSVCLNCHSTK